MNLIFLWPSKTVLVFHLLLHCQLNMSTMRVGKYINRKMTWNNSETSYCRAPRPVPSCLVPYLSLTHPLPVPYPSLTCPLPVLTCLASLVPKRMLLLSGFEFSGVKNNFKNFENKKYIGLFSKILSKLTFSDDWRKIDGLVEQNLMEGSF